MAERPILFSGPMARAILEGRKTVTRRIVKPQPKVEPHHEPIVNAAWQAGFVDVRCPYGEIGDRLWVRETFAGERQEQVGTGAVRWLHVEYRADGEYGPSAEEMGDAPRWRPSIHMPRCLSRITLEVTDVRVERLQDITAADIRAEGVDEWSVGELLGRQVVDTPLRNLWCICWDAINGDRTPWSSNPWVWRVAFKRIEGDHG